MSMDTLAEAFYDELRDVLHAEKQAVKAMPKMMKKASSPELKKAIELHIEQTKKQVERVEAAFEDTGKAPRAKTCEAMKGLVAEAEEMMKEEADPAVKDAVLISMAQKIEHYEIASYGTLCTWAEVLGYKNALKQLKANLSEEEATDQKLTQVAQSVNAAAASAGAEEEE